MYAHKSYEYLDTDHADNMIVIDGYQYITVVWEWMRHKPINDGNVYKVYGHIYASLTAISAQIWDFPISH